MSAPPLPLGEGWGEGAPMLLVIYPILVYDTSNGSSTTPCL
jgi:hypothetical protein